VSEASGSFALRGQIVTMDETVSVIDSGVVYIQGREIVRIGRASESSPPGFDGLILDTSGTIYPGLIDLHNHLSYNVLPMWSITRRFTNRNQIVRHVDYARHSSQPMRVLGRLRDTGPAIARYVEAKCLLGGVTTSGTIGLAANVGIRRSYKDGVVRIVEDPADPALPRAATRIADVKSREAGNFLKMLKKSSSVLLHLADGIDAGAREHFLSLRVGPDQWAITPSLAGIHCTALTRADFEILANHGASMIWSPLADMVRFGSTADVLSAKRAGLLIGIGPDWSVWGSKNLLAELKVARLVSEHLDDVFSPRELVAMATINAARILKWDRVLGSLGVGKRADLVVVAGRGDDPYRHLVDADESAIALVVIDGVRRYGRPDLVPAAEGTEQLSVGGEPRVLNLARDLGDSERSGAMTLAEARDRVADALGRLPDLASALADEEPGEGPDPADTKAADADDLPPRPIDAADGAEPIELDRLTVVDDPGYFDRLDAQLNLPDYVKTGLPPLYGQAPGLLLGGYTTDQPFGEDQLGIEGDVNMLCSVSAARNVDPPLSIGLFGAWGTGKSFFMEKMRARIAWLEENDRDSHSHIVQIRFNAWHYMDANLWASLAVAIFERLTDPEPVTKKQVEEREARGRAARTADRRKLLSQLDMYSELRGELDRRLAEVSTEKEGLRTELNKVREERERKAKELTSARKRQLLDRLVEDEQIQVLRQQIREMLGIDVAWTELSSVASELRSIGGQAGAIWRKLSGKKYTGLIVLSLFVSVVAALLLLAAPQIDKLLSVIPLGVAATTATWLSRRTRPVIDQVRTGLDVIEQAVVRAEEVEKDFNAEVSQQEAQLAAELATLEAQEAELGQQLQATEAREQEGWRQIRDLAQGRQLYDFLAERAASADYQRRLGIVSVLRRDFERLSILLRDTHEDIAELSSIAQLDALEDRRGEAPPNGDDGEPAGRVPQIDRIILYIDDLDRCPPSRVVEVLQAVHLLMALPLFVVVVAVDPRWLLQSLRQRYRSVLAARDPILGEEESLASTPGQYLEKIFQIPFTLPTMTDAGYAQLIASLAPEVRDEEGPTGEAVPSTPQPEPQPKPTTPPTPDARLAGRQVAVTRGTITVEAGSAASAGGSDLSGGIDLTKEEMHFAMAFRSLIQTPRLAKRMVNCYRLLRSTRYTGSASTFLGRAGGGNGEYQAVLQLLAIMNGFPTLFADVASALMAADPAMTWSSFVAGIEPQSSGSNGTGEQLIENAIVGATGERTERWLALFDSMRSLQAHVTLANDIRPYQMWAPIVARFSFSL
jgi:5-methylthioadenosine/S-adenosylhomocysteine deaminase